MNSGKRFRQLSILESFNKRQKPDYHMMSEDKVQQGSSTAGTSSTNAQEKISPDDLHMSQDLCQAALNSVNIENYDSKPGTSATTTDVDVMGKTDSGVQGSDDLLPESNSLENYSVPDASHSQELFEESETEISESQSDSEELDESPDTDEPDFSPLLNRMPDCLIPLPKLEPLENHSIMFSPHVRPGDAPRPYPRFYQDKWDSNHVRMPCSPLNRYPVENASGERRIESRWDLICRSLRSNIETSKDLEQAILKYNIQYKDRWNFQALDEIINKHWTEEERDFFFEVLLPSMIEIALSLPSICTQPVAFLKKGRDHAVTMSQKQIGCLLLNAFFCTFPRRTLPSRNSKQRWSWESATYPDINFNRLFAYSRNVEKLKCLFNYFRRIVSKEPTGTVTFHRQSIRNDMLPNWRASDRNIRTAVIKSHGLIEVEGQGMLQVDFANKFVGGGVIGTGCVQEEIRFVICPELIVSRLFTECLDNREVLIVTGVEQYSSYSGYRDAFKWEGDFKDETPRDAWGRRITKLVAMDAIHFNSDAEQYKLHLIKRELNKAYCAFYENAHPMHLPAVATGNWGCGAFKGNVNLKFLIQLMAASEVGRGLLYFTFGNKKLKKELREMYKFLTDKNLVVGDVWRLLSSYNNNLNLNTEDENVDLYDFIYSQFVSKKQNPEKQDSKCSNEDFLTDSDKQAAEMLLKDATFEDDPSTEVEDIT